MRKLKAFLAVLIFSLMATCTIWADESGERPDYNTDYYMIVESKNGGIDIHSSASETAPKINEKLIPNGTALHIEGEKEDQEKRTWGYVQYHGMHGYVPLDDCKPVRRSEAIRSEVSVSEKKEVTYDVEVSSRDKSIVLYNGPGKKFDRVSNAQEIPNGTKLSVSQEIISEDTGKWGLTEYQGIEGWVDLKETKDWKGKELPADMVEMKTEKENVTPTPSKEPVSSVAPIPSKEPANTPTPVPKNTGSPTPSLKAETSPQITKKEEKAPTKEPTEKNKASEAAEEKSEEAKETLGKQVLAEPSLISSPFVWIGILSLLAVILLLIYHFKKR